MGLLDTVNIQDNGFLPYLNTGSALDLMTGAFVPGMSGEMILNGGLTFTNAVAGKPQLFKSTELFSFILGAMAIYEGCEGWAYDTEFAQSKARLSKFVDDDCVDNVMSRFRLTDPNEHDAESFFEKLKELSEEKISHSKDYIVETPFIDPKERKPIKILIPTIVAVDSWSNMNSHTVDELYEKNELGGSGTNMVFMRDGLLKKKFMNQIPRMAAKSGFYFCLSAHIGDKFDLNPYATTTKELQHMKATDKMKSVGSSFAFLISNLIEVRSAKVLQDPDKGCQYPFPPYSNAVELNTVASVLCRCKNNASGAQMNSIISQQLGLQTDLTNYQYLKDNDFAGLDGNKQNHKVSLYPDVTLNRTAIRAKLKEDYKLHRALEILTHLKYIQDNWMLHGVEVPFSMALDKFAEEIMKGTSIAVDDVLNSRGFWTYAKHDRHYLSIYDILAIITGQYKPTWLSLGSVKKAA